MEDNRAPEMLEPETQLQIDELLKNEFICHLTSSMALSIVPVLKGQSGPECVHLAIGLHYVNSLSEGDALVLLHLSDAIHRVWASDFITDVDTNSGYWLLNVCDPGSLLMFCLTFRV